MFVWKKNRHFWTAACGFAWLPAHFGDEEIHNITNFAPRRPSSCSWPSPNLLTSSAELTRDLHDLALSLVLSAMRRTNGGIVRSNPAQEEAREKPFCRARNITGLSKNTSESLSPPCVPHHVDNTYISWSAFFHIHVMYVFVWRRGGGFQLKRTSFV